MLFDSICNSQWFTKTSMILFLNKVRLSSRPSPPLVLKPDTLFPSQVDVFKERILTSPVRVQFPDYTGPDADYNTAKEYFKTRFMSLNRSKRKEICASFVDAPSLFSTQN